MLTVLTTAQQTANNLAFIEGRLNQTTPPGNKAYNTVLAVALAMQNTSLYRFGVDRAKAALISTSLGSDLDAHGVDWNTPRNAAEAWSGTATQPCTDGTTIPLSTLYIGPTGLQYQVQASVTAPLGVSGSGATLTIVCLSAGSAGNLTAGATLTLLQPISGVTDSATVTTVTNAGTDTETDAVYQARLLAIEQASGGGGNASDYRNWAQSVAGVAKAYPYAGLPYYAYTASANPYGAQAIIISGSPTGGIFTLSFNGSTTSTLAYNAGVAALQTALRGLTGATAVTVTALTAGFLVTGFTTYAPIFLSVNSLAGGTSPTVLCLPNNPPCRTIYVECLPSYISTGIPDAALLALVKSAITYDSSGVARQPLGLTQATLFVMPITKTPIYITIQSLTVPATTTSATVQAAILSAATAYLATFFPFVDGVDAAYSRNDLITQVNLGGAVQAALTAYGASALGVTFGITLSGYLTSYQLSPGERLTLGAIAYV